MPTRLLSSSSGEATVMAKSEQQAEGPHRKTTWIRRLAATVGFHKIYNFCLWFIFSGALLGFTLARSPYFNLKGVFCATGTPPGSQLHAGPGECYYYLNFDRYYVGIRIHLIAIFLASFLVLLQFVPAIRHKLRLLHRINGYLVIVLVLISHAGAIMIAKIAFGGTLATQMFVGATALITTLSLALAVINIKRLQIDQHRAWMLRTWFYLSSIITERFIFPLMFVILTQTGGIYYAMPCNKIEWIMGSAEAMVNRYPTCAAYRDGSDPKTHAVVFGSLPGEGRSQESLAAVMDASFGASLWLALLIHAVGIEIYLRLTPAESARLKQVSYERQMERKFKNPGNAGLTAGRLGDADPYQPRSLAPIS